MASMPADHGSVDPANTASNVVSLVYKPSVELSVSGGVTAGSVTSQPSVQVTCTFGTPVTGASQAMLSVAGGTLSNFVSMSTSVFVVDASLGPANDVCVSFSGDEPASGIDPLPVSSPDFCFRFEPSVSLAWVPGDVGAGGVTSKTSVAVAVNFNSGVAGLVASDFQVAGCSVASLDTVSAQAYTLNLNLGDAATVSVGLPAAVGAVTPGNAASAPAALAATYKPLPVLSWSDSLVSGATTALESVTLMATFPTPVTGVAVSDFVLSGAFSSGVLSSCGSHCFAVRVTLTGASVSAAMPAASGSISPPNAAPDAATLVFTPAFAWTLADSLAIGGTTSAASLTATASLPAYLTVTGVVAEHFAVSGASVSSFTTGPAANTYVDLRVFIVHSPSPCLCLCSAWLVQVPHQVSPRRRCNGLACLEPQQLHRHITKPSAGCVVPSVALPRVNQCRHAGPAGCRGGTLNDVSYQRDCDHSVQHSRERIRALNARRLGGYSLEQQLCHC